MSAAVLLIKTFPLTLAQPSVATMHGERNIRVDPIPSTPSTSTSVLIVGNGNEEMEEILFAGCIFLILFFIFLVFFPPLCREPARSVAVKKWLSTIAAGGGRLWTLGLALKFTLMKLKKKHTVLRLLLEAYILWENKNRKYCEQLRGQGGSMLTFTFSLFLIDSRSEKISFPANV